MYSNIQSMKHVSAPDKQVGLLERAREVARYKRIAYAQNVLMSSGSGVSSSFMSAATRVKWA